MTDIVRSNCPKKNNNKQNKKFMKFIQRGQQSERNKGHSLDFRMNRNEETSITQKEETDVNYKRQIITKTR